VQIAAYCIVMFVIICRLHHCGYHDIIRYNSEYNKRIINMQCAVRTAEYRYFGFTFYFGKAYLGLADNE
jgi:hypothetical protein